MITFLPVCWMSIVACVCLALMPNVGASTFPALQTVPGDVSNVNSSVGQVQEEMDHDKHNTSRIQPLISDVTRHAIETVLHVAVLPLVVLCGVIMNGINMAVFLRQGLSDRINICLFSLAICHTGYMLFVLANRLRDILDYIDDTAAQFWRFQSLSLIGVYVAFLNTSNCLTLLISLERCFCVVWPLKAKTIISDRTLKCLIALAFILSSCNMLFAFKFAVMSYQDPATKAIRYRLVFTDFYHQHRNLVDSILENFNMVVPTTSVTVVMATTTVIVVRMRSVLEWRQGRAQTTSKDQREASLTRMLMVICIMYTVCTLPYVTHAFFRLTVKEFRPGGQLQNTANTTIGMVHTVLSINASANFVVYYTMSTRFKETLYQMIKRTAAKTTRGQTLHKVTTTT